MSGFVVRADEPEPFDFGDLAIRDYTAGREARSSLARIEVPPGGRHPEAWSRRSDKLYVVLAGTVHFRLDGEPVDLSEGDACVVPQGTPFAYENPLAEPAVLLLVHTPPFRPEDEMLVDADRGSAPGRTTRP